MYGITNNENNTGSICAKCFSYKPCECHCRRFEVDESIAEAISILNQKGYKTTFSCGGHLRKDYTAGIYTRFAEAMEILPKEIGAMWRYVKSTHTLYFEVYDMCYLFDKLSKEEILIDKRKELLLWAKNLRNKE